MITLLIFGIIWTIYGILGLFGIQNIPPKYKGKVWTKSYIRSQGASWLLLGVMYLITYTVVRNMQLKAGILIIIVLIAALPAIIYSLFNDKKYKKLLDEE